MDEPTPHQGDFPGQLPSKLRFDGPFKARVKFRSDPLQAGRVKVQVVGIHDESESVEFLPWAWPSSRAWQEGGDIMIPPVNSLVDVTFENGDHEYPKYHGGWWVTEEPRGVMPKGQSDLSKHVRWATSAFGSYQDAKHSDGILKLEDRAEPKNAPNNFIRSSPLGKRLELDDRARRGRLVLADEQDNGLFVNTERGSLVLETYQGSRDKSPSLKGFLMSSEKEKGYFQIYSARGWRISESDQNRFLEMVSPSGIIVRLDDQTQTAEMWTPGGRRVAMSDSNSRIELRSPEGRGVVIDDEAGALLMSSNTTGMYVVIADKDRLLELRSTGNIALKADGNILLGAAGNIITDGQVTALQPGVFNNLNPSVSFDLARSKILYREGAPFFKRPYEHEEQKDP